MKDNFGSRLKKARYDANISQIKLAELAGISQPQIVKYEKNLVIPVFDKIQKIAKHLGVTAEWLLEPTHLEESSKERFNTFGQRLSGAMERSSIDAKKLSVITAIDEGIISCYMNDEKPPVLPHIEAISGALNVNKTWLAFGIN